MLVTQKWLLVGWEFFQEAKHNLTCSTIKWVSCATVSLCMLGVSSSSHSLEIYCPAFCLQVCVWWQLQQPQSAVSGSEISSALAPGWRLSPRSKWRHASKPAHYQVWHCYELSLSAASLPTSPYHESTTSRTAFYFLNKSYHHSGNKASHLFLCILSQQHCYVCLRGWCANA